MTPDETRLAAAIEDYDTEPSEAAQAAVALWRSYDPMLNADALARLLDAFAQKRPAGEDVVSYVERCNA